MRRRGASPGMPRSGPAREALRQKGQFWTPPWVADAMVAYALGGGSAELFDPAVGPGIFFKAARNHTRDGRSPVSLVGTEIDPETLADARRNGLSDLDLRNVQIRDFVLDPPEGPFRAIVANPPYIRHHRLPPETKARLRTFSSSLLGEPIDGRAGLHIYFLLRALQKLADGGRLAFILPADTCEGVFAGPLWRWITRRYRIDAVVTFDPKASPFPGVDTNPIIILLARSSPIERFHWIRCTATESDALKCWIGSAFKDDTSVDLQVQTRTLKEGLATGLTRPPNGTDETRWVLGDFADVVRGIATGANEYFYLTGKEAAHWKLPPEFLSPAIGRTRDVPGDEVTAEDLRRLEARGRPTRLLSLDDRTEERFPTQIQKYLKKGVEMGLPLRPLIATRRPWYKMEDRRPPAFLFAYLGRRNTRFIRNMAGVVPLTGFLCVYPHHSDPQMVEGLWQILRDSRTIANLTLVGKSYGSGAIKVEPRALERLALPADLITLHGLEKYATPRQAEIEHFDKIGVTAPG